MKKALLSAFITMTVPLLLFVNVWQSQRYMIDYFEVKSLVSDQEEFVQSNKRLVNRMAELESPTRLISMLDSDATLRKIGGGEIVRIEVVNVNE